MTLDLLASGTPLKLEYGLSNTMLGVLNSNLTFAFLFGSRILFSSLTVLSLYREL